MSDLLQALSTVIQQKLGLQLDPEQVGTLAQQITAMAKPKEGA